MADVAQDKATEDTPAEASPTAADQLPKPVAVG